MPAGQDLANKLHRVKQRSWFSAADGDEDEKPEEEEPLQKNIYDRDGDGDVSGDELMDLDGDGDVDEMDRLLYKFDLNKDGVYGIDEVKAMVEQLEAIRNSKQEMIRMFVLMFMVAMAVCGIFFGITLLANESAKESHTETLSERDLSGEVIQMDQAKKFTTLIQLRELERFALSQIKRVQFVYLDRSVVPPSRTEVYFRLVGYHRDSPDGVMLTLLTSQCYTEVDILENSARLVIGNATHRALESYDIAIGTNSTRVNGFYDKEELEELNKSMDGTDICELAGHPDLEAQSEAEALLDAQRTAELVAQREAEEAALENAADADDSSGGRRFLASTPLLASSSARSA